jgi:hypothetical protein
MPAEGHLLVVLHKVPTGKDPERHAIAYWRNSQGQWACSAGGDGLSKLTSHVAEYEKRVDQLEAEYDAADGADAWFGVLQHVVRVHRATSNLLATLQSAREAAPEDRDVITLRDRASDVERAIDLLHHDVKNALDYAVARQAEEQAKLTYQLTRAGHRITMLAAVFFPLTAISSLFGMNLRSGLESAPPAVFWGVTAVSVTSGFVLLLSMAAGSHARAPTRRPQRDAKHRTKLARPGQPRL